MDVLRMNLDRRFVLALTMTVVGISISWLAETPFGLLAPLAAVFVYMPLGGVPFLNAILAIFLIGSGIAGFLEPGARQVALSWCGLAAMGLCVGALIRNVMAGPHGDRPAVDRTAGGDPGVVPGELAAANAAPSLSHIHPDDRQAVAQAASYAFWTGVPQVVTCRQYQEGGGYRLTELNADPGYRVGVAVDPMVSATGERWTPYGSIGETGDALAAARVVESLHGKAWAFDPAGNFTYVTSAAQSAIDMTLKDLNAPLGGGAFVDGGEVGWMRKVHPHDVERAAATLRHSLITGEPWNIEYRMLRATGQYVWHRVSARPVRDHLGRITGWYGTSIDIDVYKRTEEALRERERELSQLVDMTPSHVWRLTAAGEASFFNRRMTDFLGHGVEDLARPGMTQLAAMMENAIHPEDIAAFRETLGHSLTTGKPFAMRYRLRRADGAYRWMSSRAEPLRDEQERIVQWYGLCHDIEDQVHAENALRRSEQHLQRLIGALPVNVVSWTPEGELTYVSERYLDEVGLAKPGFEELEMTAHERVHPDDAAEVRREAARAIQGGKPFRMRYRRREKDGAYRWLDGRFEPLRNERGAIVEWFGVSVDIDDLMRAQEALRDREREFSQLVAMAPGFLWRLTPEGHPVFFSKRMVEYFGLDVVDYDKPGKPGLASVMADLVHPEDIGRLTAALNHSFETGESFSLDYRLRRADGVYRWMSGRAEPLRDESGHILQWYGLSHDVEDQVRIAEALRERERALWQLVETLPAMIDCAAPDGEPIYRSQQLREYLGYELEELDSAGRPRLGGTLDAGVHPEDVTAVKEDYARSLATGQPYARRHRLRRFDGEYRWVETRAAPMRDAAGSIVQWNVICLDIDGEVRAQRELRLAKESLARASQAASLAELSASIAHEVNQPLAAIVANSHACHRWLSAEPPNLERAKITAARITRDANSAADVVSRIRALFRQEPRARSPEDVNRVIGEVCRLVADEIAGRNIHIEADLDESLPAVALDRVQVQQVFVNLIRNGVEAMDGVAEGGGSLLIRSSREGANTIRIEISDSGSGFQDPERVLEPFFTTKPQGMGMGLAICRSIIESHGGRIWTANNATRGATVAFTLPLTEGRAP